MISTMLTPAQIEAPFSPAVPCRSREALRRGAGGSPHHRARSKPGRSSRKSLKVGARSSAREVRCGR